MFPDPLRAQLDRPHGGSYEALNGVPDALEHAAHHVLATLVEHEFEHDPVAGRADKTERVSVSDAVLKLHTSAKRAPYVSCDGSDDLRQIGLGNLVGGVSQAVGELAVVHDEKQPLGLQVKPADMEDPVPASPEHVADTQPTLGVLHRGDHAERLVEGQVGLVTRGRDAHAVYAHDSRLWIDPAALLTHHVAVDGDPPFGDQLLAGTSRGDARRRQYLLEANTFFKIHLNLMLRMSPARRL